MKKINILAFLTLSTLSINSYSDFKIHMQLENNGNKGSGPLPLNSIVFSNTPEDEEEIPTDPQEENKTCEFGIGAGQVITQWRELSNGTARIYWRNNTVTISVPAGETEYIASSGTKYQKGEFKQTAGAFKYYEVCQLFDANYTEIWVPVTTVSNWTNSGKYYQCGTKPTIGNNLPYDSTITLEHCYSEQEKVTTNKEIVVDTGKERILSTTKDYQYVENWRENSVEYVWVTKETPYNCENEYPMENTIDKGTYYTKNYINCTVDEKEMKHTSRTNLQMNNYTEVVIESTGNTRIVTGKTLTQTEIGTKE